MEMKLSLGRRFLMTKVVLDQQTREKLNGLKSSLSIHDENGKPLGFFFTTAEYEQMMMEWVKKVYTPEVLDKLSQQKGGRTTAEVLERLKKL
jgi:hypothetical protein